MLESHLHRNHPSRSGCVAPIARHVTDHEEPGTPWLGWVDTAALLDQAQAYELAGSLRHAEAAYSSLIVAATRQEDHAILSVAFRRRAVLAHHAGDSARARSALQQSYAVASMLGDRRLTAETLNTLGGLELETRNLEAAEQALLEAEALASQDPTILARVEQNLGIVSNIRGDLDLAETHYRRSLVAYEALPDPHGSAIAHHNLGMLAADRGDFAKASEHYATCEKLADDSRDLHLVALCLLNHAEVLVALDRPTSRAAERGGGGADVPGAGRALRRGGRAAGAGAVRPGGGSAAAGGGAARPGPRAGAADGRAADGGGGAAGAGTAVPGDGTGGGGGRAAPRGSAGVRGARRARGGGSDGVGGCAAAVMLARTDPGRPL